MWLKQRDVVQCRRSCSCVCRCVVSVFCVCILAVEDYVRCRSFFGAAGACGGFHKLSADETRGLVREPPIRIPPGHFVVFVETLVHEVLAKASPATSIRLFYGWRLTSTAST